MADSKDESKNNIIISFISKTAGMIFKQKTVQLNLVFTRQKNEYLKTIK